MEIDENAQKQVTTDFLKIDRRNDFALSTIPSLKMVSESSKLAFGITKKYAGNPTMADANNLANE